MTEQHAPIHGSQVTIEMWADLGCPWCYLGKHRLSAAIEQRPDADRFEIVVRSFQLDPAAPQEPEPNETSFIRMHGGTVADVRRAERQMQASARAEGLAYSPDRMNANTFDLHRVVQYANDEGRGSVFFSAVQDGFFAGTLDPYGPGVLADVASSVGLDGGRVEQILASDDHADRVRADRTAGTALGGTGVPFVVVGRRVAAAGALSVACYGELLDRVAGPVPSGHAS